MIVKYILLATIAFLGALTVVEAQHAQTEQSTEPVPITLEFHNALTHGGTVISGARMSSPQTLEASMNSDQVTAAATGWNYVHANACLAFFDGVNTWLYIYPSEGGVLWTGDLGAQTTIAPACQTGNLLGFYTVNTNGYWNQVAVYPHR